MGVPNNHPASATPTYPIVLRRRFTCPLTPRFLCRIEPRQPALAGAGCLTPPSRNGSCLAALRRPRRCSDRTDRQPNQQFRATEAGLTRWDLQLQLSRPGASGVGRPSSSIAVPRRPGGSRIKRGSPTPRSSGATRGRSAPSSRAGSRGRCSAEILRACPGNGQGPARPH
jgi:hypothetical protein